MYKLNVEDLKQYLFHVRDLESSCYKQEQYIDFLEKSLDKAKHPSLQAMGATRAKESMSGDVFDLCINLGKLGAIVGAVIGFIVFLKHFRGFFSNIFLFGLLGIILGAAAGLIIAGIAKAKADSAVDSYNKSVMRSNDRKRAENALLQQNCQARIPLIQAELDKARETYRKTRDTLEMYYSENVIYPKYRGLVPVTTFCEYFESGRCSDLTGHEGAYNIYEDEIRSNLIIVQLSDVISHLKSIETNQYMLSQLVTDCRNEIGQLSSAVDQQSAQLRQISSNTEVASYYGQITAQNTAFTNWLMVRQLTD